MTKMKSKKMTKSTIAIIIMSIAMVAMLAFGGTFAYFTAQAQKATGTVTTAVIELVNDNNTLTLTNAAGLLPYQESETTVTLKNTNTTVDTWIFLDLTYALKTAGTTTDSSDTDTGVFAIKSVTADNSVTFSALTVSGKTVYGSTAVVPSSVDTLKVTITFTYNATANNVNGAGQKEMGASYEVTIDASSIQNVSSAGTAFANAQAAWDAKTGA